MISRASRKVLQRALDCLAAAAPLASRSFLTISPTGFLPLPIFTQDGAACAARPSAAFGLVRSSKK